MKKKIIATALALGLIGTVGISSVSFAAPVRNNQQTETASSQQMQQGDMQQGGSFAPGQQGSTLSEGVNGNSADMGQNGRQNQFGAGNEASGAREGGIQQGGFGGQGMNEQQMPQNAKNRPNAQMEQNGQSAQNGQNSFGTNGQNTNRPEGGNFAGMPEGEFSEGKFSEDRPGDGMDRENEEKPGSAIKSAIDALESGDVKTACEEAFEAFETAIKAEIDAEHNEDASEDDIKALKKTTNTARKALDKALEDAGVDMTEILKIPEKKEGNKKFLKKAMKKDVIQEIE